MTRQQLIRDQADQANQEAVRGGIDGGIRWFLSGVIVFGTQLVWPLYRGLTPQFKVCPRPRCLMKSYFCYLRVAILESRLILVTAAGAVINAEHRFVCVSLELTVECWSMRTG